MSSKFFGNKQDNKTNKNIKKVGKANSKGSKIIQVQKTGRGK